MSKQQTFGNHSRVDPLFHYVILPILLVNVLVTIAYVRAHYYQHRHIGPWLVFVSITLLLMAELTRMYALKAQDRTIRLEEKLRLASLASASELAELESLTMRQYVALRFASNPELPELARRAVREKLTSKQIKQAIVAWRPDHDRI